MLGGFDPLRFVIWVSKIFFNTNVLKRIRSSFFWRKAQSLSQQALALAQVVAPEHFLNYF
jgi:hypothetical protein